jgi:hypothetical protein
MAGAGRGGRGRGGFAAAARRAGPSMDGLVARRRPAAAAAQRNAVLHAGGGPMGRGALRGAACVIKARRFGRAEGVGHELAAHARRRAGAS